MGFLSINIRSGIQHASWEAGQPLLLLRYIFLPSVPSQPRTQPKPPSASQKPCNATRGRQSLHSFSFASAHFPSSVVGIKESSSWLPLRSVRALYHGASRASPSCNDACDLN